MGIMILHTNFQNKVNQEYLGNLGNKSGNFYNTSTKIKNDFNFISQEENIQSINYTFSIPYQNNTGNSNNSETHNMTHTQFPKCHISNTIIDSTSNKIECEDIQQITNNHYIKNQEQTNIDTNVISSKDEISYKTAYALLLNLVNYDIKLLKEILLIAESLVNEGVSVAPESRVKRHIAKAILSRTQQYKKNTTSRSR
ncbi:hypothetical protein FDZ58_01830 [Ehrlichia ruminantium]|nr:hypothetical protein AUR40_04755 [Ehrlichia ruminantium]QLK50405.1 hypothetical protein FDZ68_01820 [Ehrlichia ruminantium]QLK51329.1 hypothetical protein FDZ66_01825 [Ehrlichia ruminantium]QLK53165.1 hypothetical protein FDZ64_01825 [Ehrlichia ruminantium]QLK58667.1 hypothetical protein FDZ58_01830 [Ehrlichia ruminantium]